MTSRRGFIAGLLSTGLVPAATWADAGAPAYLAAAAQQDGRFVLCGIMPDMKIAFRLPLPARGHAAAAHPIRPEAVAFARRPGTFALVVDCRSGQIAAELTAPEGRHFYGHGAFSQDGRWLYTTENDFAAGRGCIGVWDSTRRYTRVGEFGSGGIGPHEIRRLPGSETLVVANGGIDTHPDSGRAKLNIPIMQPNLSYIDDRKVVETAQLPQAMHKNSIRHLAVSRRGAVAFGMQWQGEGTPGALVGVHRRGQPITLCTAPDGALRDMQGYIGSVAIDGDDKSIAVTSPRGGRVQVYDLAAGAFVQEISLPDACGVAPARKGLIVTTGEGILKTVPGPGNSRRHAGVMFDNHLVQI